MKEGLLMMLLKNISFVYTFVRCTASMQLLTDHGTWVETMQPSVEFRLFNSYSNTVTFTSCKPDQLCTKFACLTYPTGCEDGEVE